MRHGKWLIALITTAFLALVLLCAYLDPVAEQKTDPTDSFWLEVTTDDGAEGIHYVGVYAWGRETTEFVAVLPGYADLFRSVIRLTSEEPVFLNDIPLVDGMVCGGFALEERYTLTLPTGATYGFRFLQSGDVPTLHIDVQSGSMDHIHALKGNRESGWMRLYDADGTVEYHGRLAQINGRGNASWERTRKGYSLTLPEETDLLGMGQAKSWILLANAGDPSNLRNKIVYDFAGAAGLAYSPECRWVDLYLNGDYAGLFLLSERNEVHPQRVNIPEETGFLVSLELENRLVSQHYPHIVTESGGALRIHHGLMGEDALLERWQSLENAILAKDGVDPVTGKSYLEFIDLDSWVKKYLVEEIFANGDAGAISQYFYSETIDGMVFAGPVWDYDVSMGADTWQMANPEMFYANRPVLRKGMDESWFHALYQKPEFYDRMVTIYREEMKPLLETLLTGTIDAYAAETAWAARQSEERWNALSAQEEIDHIRRYLTARIAFLDSVWLEDQPYFLVSVDKIDGFNAACFAVRPGAQVPPLPAYGENPDIFGWYVRETGEPFDLSQPIYQDMEIYLKRKEPPKSSLSPVQFAPVGILLLLLAAVCLADRKNFRCRTGKKTGETELLSPTIDGQSDV